MPVARKVLAGAIDSDRCEQVDNMCLMAEGPTPRCDP